MSLYRPLIALAASVLISTLPGCNSPVNDAKLSSGSNANAKPPRSVPERAPSPQPTSVEAPPIVEDAQVIAEPVVEDRLDAACAKHVIIDGDTVGPFSCVREDGICEGLFASKSGNGVCQRRFDNQTSPPCCDYSTAVGCDGEARKYEGVLLNRKCRSYVSGSSSTFCNSRGFCENMFFNGGKKCLVGESASTCPLSLDSVVNCADGKKRNITQETFDAKCAGFARKYQLSGVKSLCDKDRICTGFSITAGNAFVVGEEQPKVVDCNGNIYNRTEAKDHAVCRGLSRSLQRPFESQCEKGFCGNLTFSGKTLCSDHFPDGSKNQDCLSMANRTRVTCKGLAEPIKKVDALDTNCRSISGFNNTRCIAEINVCEGVYSKIEGSGFCRLGDDNCNFKSFVTCDGHLIKLAPKGFDRYCNSLGKLHKAQYDSTCDAKTFTCKGLFNREGITCAVDINKQVSCCAAGDPIRCDGLVGRRPNKRTLANMACKPSS